jgi:hypothetical protein
MIDEARVKRMIDIADELIVELADRGFDAAESGVVLALAAIQTAKALGRSKVEIVDSLDELCDLCRVEDGGMQ